jgi:hypothetical protein
MKLKSIVLFGALAAVASGGLYAQEVAINGKDFESGAGDAKLAEIARQAAASGKTVVISTPPYWQAKAAAKLRAASPNVQVKTNDVFVENVLVRIVDAPKSETKPAELAKPAEAPVAAKPATPPKPAPAPAPVAPKPALPVEAKPAVAAAPKPIVAAPVKAEPAKAVAPAVAAPVAAPPAPPVAAAPVAAVAPQPASAPKVEAPAPAPAVAPAPVAAPAPHAEVNLAEARKRVEGQLNLGKAADGMLKPTQLQKDDEIFVSGPVRAVVRRFGSHVQLFWLEGALNLERTELTMKSTGHYKVNEPIQGEATVRAMHTKPNLFTAQVPEAKSQIRSDMEKHFNDSKPIADTLRPDQLQYGDLFYVYRTYAVVFRRSDLSLDHYWLNGQVDLNQAGIVKDGDAWRVVSDRL